MIDALRMALRSAGLRCTPARLSVLGTLDALGQPVTHADLSAHPDVAGMDDITLYRTLGTLVDAGLIHRVQGIDGAWRYCVQPRDRAGCPGNHPHFLCTGCRRMECLVDQAMPRVRVPEGAEVRGRHFVVYGRCAACAAASAGSGAPG
ncbi:transcriptional repressor [Myxococcota bacterium]|nr:transcriptional repressor [Myxococcota bacterium]